MSKLNKFRPFFYGIGELSPTAIDIFLKVYLLIYFNQIIGLSPTSTSIVIGLSVLWDAAIDPWIGGFTDRYREKRGDRKLIMYIAGFAMAFAFFILWHIPHQENFITCLLLFVACALLNSSISFFSVSYYAIANDLEKDDQNRRKWIGWRLIFFNIGSIIGLGIPAYYLTSIQVNEQKSAYLSAITLLSGMTLVLSMLATKLIYYKAEPIRFSKQNKNINLKAISKDKIFLQVLAAFLVVNCGLGLNSTLAIYYYKDFLNFTEKETQIILLSFLGCFTISVPIWVSLTKLVDKKKLIIAGAIALGVLTMSAFPNFHPNSFSKVLAIASGLGGLLVGVAVVMEIYLSDYLHEKEYLLQQSISGQFLGFWKMASKIARAIAISLAGPIIEISKGQPQTLANFFGFGVGFFFFLAALIFSFRATKSQ